MQANIPSDKIPQVQTELLIELLARQTALENFIIQTYCTDNNKDLAIYRNKFGQEIQHFRKSLYDSYQEKYSTKPTTDDKE